MKTNESQQTPSGGSDDRLVRWCVLSRDGWCGVKGGKRPATTENSVETRCGMWVSMPWGIERRKPTCPDCIKANKDITRP